jgi:hypothetical protein
VAARQSFGDGGELPGNVCWTDDRREVKSPAASETRNAGNGFGAPLGRLTDSMDTGGGLGWSGMFTPVAGPVRNSHNWHKF